MSHGSCLQISAAVRIREGFRNPSHGKIQLTFSCQVFDKMPSVKGGGGEEEEEVTPLSVNKFLRTSWENLVRGGPSGLRLPSPFRRKVIGERFDSP